MLDFFQAVSKSVLESNMKHTTISPDLFSQIPEILYYSLYHVSIVILTTYKIFYIGPAQWLVTFLVSPKSFLSPFHTIFDSMRKAFLTFWRTSATMFSRCLITLFVNEFHLSLEDNLPKQCKVKNSLTFHVQPLYNFI